MKFNSIMLKRILRFNGHIMQEVKNYIHVSDL